MSNIIDTIQVSGVTYTIAGSGSGNSVVEVTQAQYDALVSGGTVDPTILYIITDAQAGDLTNYYTKTETNTLLGGKADTATTYTKTEVDNAITAATSTKQDTLVSGTNIKTINNESILGSGNIDIQGGGGGKAVSGGTNISITTGETADTINCTLPISVGGPFNSCLDLTRNTGNSLQGSGNVAFGSYVNVTNNGELGFGRYNISNTTSSSPYYNNPNKTLLSVGNGTANKERHNAFEIRQNGDIYITLDGQDVKLQDQLGGGSITVDDMLSSTSTNPVQNKVVKSATDRICKLFGYGTSGQTDILSWATGATSAVIDDYVQFSKINGKKIIGNGVSPTDNFSLVETSAITTSISSSSTDSQVPSAKAVYESVSGKVDTSSMTGYVTTDTAQEITGEKTFVGEKKLKFKQSGNSSKIGFTLYNSASTNNELATFEFRPNTYTVDSVQHPLMYIGHYRNTNTANAGVPQTVIGFRQYDQANSAAYHLFAPLPEEAKTPFSLTTSFQNYFIPLGFKNGSTMIKTDNTGVADFSDVLGGLKLVKLTQSEYDNLSTKDSNTLYVIVN